MSNCFIETLFILLAWGWISLKYLLVGKLIHLIQSVYPAYFHQLCIFKYIICFISKKVLRHARTTIHVYMYTLINMLRRNIAQILLNVCDTSITTVTIDTGVTVQLRNKPLVLCFYGRTCTLYIQQLITWQIHSYCSCRNTQVRIMLRT